MSKQDIAIIESLKAEISSKSEQIAKLYRVCNERDVLKNALNAVVDAWEMLPGGQRHGWRVVERWMQDKLTPAVRAARKALGRVDPGTGKLEE